MDGGQRFLIIQIINFTLQYTSFFYLSFIKIFVKLEQENSNMK